MPDSRQIDIVDVTVTGDTAEFTVRNGTGEQVYDIVKLYIGEKYIGFDYLDLEPGEERAVSFDIGSIDAGETPDTVLTTHNRNDGVLFNTPFNDLEATGTEHGDEPATPATSTADAAAQTDAGTEAGADDEADDVAKKVEEIVSKREEQEARAEQPEKHRGYVSSLMGSLFGGGKHKDDEEPEAEQPEEDAGDMDAAEDGERQPHVERAMDPDKVKGKQLPSEQVNRVSTGVIDLDDKMQGGLVAGTMNLVTGKTGTGKTAFCATFLKRGADLDEPGVYVTTEERKEDIRADIQSMFGWDIEELEEEGNIKVMSIKPIFPSKEIENLNRLVRSYITDLLDNVKQAIEELDADRVVIDSVSIIEMFIRDEYMARVALSSLLNSLREADVTAVLTGTVPETSEGLSGGGIIEFLVDTVILLEFVPVAEEHKRTLTIRKMRRTNHAVDIFPFEITPDGLQVYSPR